MNKQYSE